MVAKIVPWIVTVLLSIVAPIVVYAVATDNGVATVPALILSGIPPLLEMVGTAVFRGRLDELSTIILILIVVSTVSSLLLDDSRLLLIKGGVVCALLGVAYLVTVPTSRPLCFLIGRRFATGGDPERLAWWNGLWNLAGFRRTQRAMTAMWGLGFLVFGVTIAVLVFYLPTGAMVVIDNVGPGALVAVLMVVTIVWGRRAQAAGERRAAAEATAEATGDPQPA